MVINKKNNIEIFINIIIRKYNIIYTYQGQKKILLNSEDRVLKYMIKGLDYISDNKHILELT